MHFIDYLSPFMQYLARDESAHANNIPSLKILSQDLGLSISTIREQMEVARVLGLVEVRPRVGIRRQEYSFLPAILKALGMPSSLTDHILIHFQTSAPTSRPPIGLKRFRS